jgi:hypothetical protein
LSRILGKLEKKRKTSDLRKKKIRKKIIFFSSPQAIGEEEEIEESASASSSASRVHSLPEIPEAMEVEGNGETSNNNNNNNFPSNTNTTLAVQDSRLPSGNTLPSGTNINGNNSNITRPNTKKNFKTIPRRKSYVFQVLFSFMQNWPQGSESNTHKEVLFLKEIGQVLNEHVTPEEWTNSGTLNFKILGEHVTPEEWKHR